MLDLCVDGSYRGSNMEIDRLIELEIRVREEVDRLHAELDAGKEATAPPESLDGTIGRLSRQDSLMQQELAKDAQRRRMRRLELLREALARMDDGTFGTCHNCGDEIAEERLMAAPENPLCARCRLGGPIGQHHARHQVAPDQPEHGFKG